MLEVKQPEKKPFSFLDKIKGFTSNLLGPINDRINKLEESAETLKNSLSSTKDTLTAETKKVTNAAITQMLNQAEKIKSDAKKMQDDINNMAKNERKCKCCGQKNP